MSNYTDERSSRAMINALIRNGVRAALALRYRIRVSGLREIAQRGTRGILFLPNHPALIDPVIVMSRLHKCFAPRALGDKDQMDRFIVRWFAKRMGVRPVPDLAKHGPAARDQVAAIVAACAEGLRGGENLLLYPAGHLYRSRLENLRGNSAVESILRETPEARVVLVRTRGLWGSTFSFADGEFPDLARGLRKGAPGLLASFVFFAPRRGVTLELVEPDDFPRQGDRNELNAYLQRFYNEDAPPNRYVPYSIWERGGVRELPDRVLERGGESVADVPETTRRLVCEHLRELTGVEKFADEDRLAQDLGLDSLSRAELVVWLGGEFGFHAGDVASLQTVGDLLLAARGQASSAGLVELKPIARRWFERRSDGRARVPEGARITDLFLKQAARGPGRIVVADQLSGAKSFRDLITAVLVLKPLIEKMPGRRIGIMLPASVAATTAYLATLFAGKTPVMVNWTTGARNVKHALDVTEVERVLT
ncbi:MAG: 2-acyl-glycerophospho-ethanolamine acyltransferase, partial [Planctomycetes bacterium]|nr:2-acyl-glycerophospho-ethanolamine acyltransferase [Planctomycetota bacterium]